mgnify:CR=1 FL=1
MTLSKLSLRNAKRQTEDYLVYFATIIMAAALLYAFNGMIFSREIKELSSGLSMLTPMIVLASMAVVCIFGWLVSYAANFMLTRRSRELGLYILIGLENQQVARLFFLENLAVGGVASGLGILLGNLLFQMLRAIILALFGQMYHFEFTFSIKAVGLTVVYFVMLYLFALWRSRKKIRTMKIYDLIYFDRQNEGEVIKTGRRRRWIFTVSVVFGAVGTVLLMARDLLTGVIGAFCVILFLFGFFLSFASGVPAFFDKRPRRKYRGENLLVFRTLTAKLGTMGVTMAAISLLFTATLMAEGTGLVMRGILEGRAAEGGCFDLYIATDEDTPIAEEYLECIAENIPVEASVAYNVYLDESARIMDYIYENTVYYNYSYDQDALMRYSDYNALREAAGYGTVELVPGQYILHCTIYLEMVLEDHLPPVIVGDAKLVPGGIYTEHFLQNSWSGNGPGYILVVPDEAVENCSIHHRSYAARTVMPVSEEQFKMLNQVKYNLYEAGGNDERIVAKSMEEAEAASMTAITVFPLYYLALALIMTAATILTIQQLSESERYRTQFGLLHKLGMDIRRMRRALRRQCAIYYAMPVLPSVLISVPFIRNLAGSPEPGIMVGASSPSVIIFIVLALFFLMYGVYILIAYTSLKRNVLQEASR